MKILMIIVSLMLLLVGGCGKGSDPTRTPNDFVPVTSIRIAADYSKIAAKTSMRLKVTGNHSGVYESDLTSQAVWASGAKTFADFVTTAQPDRISGLLPGDAVITAKVGTMTATFPLTVTNEKMTLLTIVSSKPSIAKGLFTECTAIGTFKDGPQQDVTYDVTWSVTNGAAGSASVGAVPSNRVVITGSSVGDATIKALFTNLDNTTCEGSAALTITAAELQSIAFSSENQTVDIFSPVAFTVTGTLTDGSPQNNVTGKWISSNENVAKIVADTGVVTLMGAGTSSISVSSGGVSAKTDLIVRDFSLQPASTTSVSVKVGTTLKLSVSAKSSNGTEQDVTTKCVWSPTSNNTIATVSDTDPNKGVVTAGSSPGQTTTVTATYGGKLINFTIAVTQ